MDVIEGRGGGCWGVYVITCLVVYVANIPTGGRGMDWDGVLVMSCGKVVIVVDGAGIFLGACFTGWFCGKGRRGGGGGASIW